MKRDHLALGALGAVMAAGLIAWYVGNSGGQIAATAPDDPALVSMGKSLYAKECASCHGANLQGQVPDWRTRLADGSLPAPPHDATGHTWHHADALLFEITKHGRLRAAPRSGPSTMPAFAEKLSDREIWAVLSYIKSTWPADIRARHDRINRQSRPGR